MKRKEGYYWVKNKENEWMIALYTSIAIYGKKSVWFFAGNECDLDDKEMGKQGYIIDERRIIRQKK